MFGSFPQFLFPAMRGLAAISRLASLGHKRARAKPNGSIRWQQRRHRPALTEDHHAGSPCCRNTTSAPGRGGDQLGRTLDAPRGCGVPGDSGIATGSCFAMVPSRQRERVAACTGSDGCYWALWASCGSPWSCRIPRPRRLPDWFPIGVAPATAGNSCPTWPSPTRANNPAFIRSFSPSPNSSFRCSRSPRGIDREGSPLGSTRGAARRGSACVARRLLAESSATRGVERKLLSASLEPRGTIANDGVLSAALRETASCLVHGQEVLWPSQARRDGLCDRAPAGSLRRTDGKPAGLIPCRGGTSRRRVPR